MNTATYIYSIDTIEDLMRIPDWVIDEINLPIGWLHIYLRHSKIDQLEHELNRFTRNIFGEKLVSRDDLLHLWSGDKHELKDLISIINEQRHYFYLSAEIKLSFRENPKIYKNWRRWEDCNIWIIISTINGYPYGAVFAFQNREKQEDLLIQGISKFPIPYLFSLIDPKTSNKLPKLNHLLIPKVEELGRDIGAKRIIVEPIANQGSILEKHYGFHKISKFDHPCTITFKAAGASYYEKRIT